MKNTTVMMIKFNENIPGKPDLSNIEEHLKIQHKNGMFCWGHSKNGTLNEMTKDFKLVVDQIKNEIETFVFLYCNEKKLLYVGTLVDIYTSTEVKKCEWIEKLLPEYYRYKFGKIDDKNIERLLNRYFLIKDLTQIDFDERDNLYTLQGNKITVGQSSIMRCHIKEELSAKVKQILYSSTDIQYPIGDVNLVEVEVTDTTLAPEDQDSEELKERKKQQKRKIKNDYIGKHIKNEAIGDAGEELLLKYEKETLIKKIN